MDTMLWLLSKTIEALPLSLALFASLGCSFWLGLACGRRFGLFTGLRIVACIGAIVSVPIGAHVASGTVVSLSLAGVDLMAAACLCFSAYCFVPGFLIAVAFSEPRDERKCGARCE